MANNDQARVEYLRSLSTRLRFTSDSVGNEKRSEDNMPHIADSYARILELVGEDPSRQVLEEIVLEFVKTRLPISKNVYFSFTENLKNNFALLCAHGVTVWKNGKFSLTKEIFRKINSLVFYVIKPLISRNFCQKKV